MWRCRVCGRKARVRRQDRGTPTMPWSVWACAECREDWDRCVKDYPGFAERVAAKAQQFQRALVELLLWSSGGQ